MQEAVDKPLQEVTLAFLGDGRSPIAPSLATGAAKLGMDFRIVSPPIFWPAPSFIADVTSGAHEHDGKFAVLEHVGAGVLGADFVYTAAWLGEQETGWAERIRLLAPFGVRADVMEATGNPGCKFMHCLPSFHDSGSKAGDRVAKQFGLDCMEVSDTNFEPKASVVFDQAERPFSSQPLGRPMREIETVTTARVSGYAQLRVGPTARDTGARPFRREGETTRYAATRM